MLAFDRDGNAIIVDNRGSDDSIVKLSADWSPLTEFGEFDASGAWLAADSRGRVLVADAYNSRVHVFAPDGQQQSEWGAFGGLDGQLRGPEGIAIDSHDDVYILDRGNNRIQVFDTAGKFLRKWPLTAFDITIGVDDNIYLLTENNILNVDRQGTVLEVGADNAGHRFYAIAAHPNGTVYALQLGSELDPASVHQFSNRGEPLNEWNVFTGSEAGNSDAIDIGVTGNGDIAVCVRGRIRVFDEQGAFIEDVRSTTGTVEPLGSQAIAMDQNGRLYVAERPLGAFRIRSFNDTGQPHQTWQGAWTPSSGFPRALAINSSGTMYFLLRNTGGSDDGRVFAVSLDGEVVATWDRSPTDFFRNPLSIAVDEEDSVFVLDTDNHQVVKFNSEGHYITAFGRRRGSGQEEFRLPSDVAIDQNGDLFVVDAGNNRVQRLTATGTYVSEWTILPGSQRIALSEGRVHIATADRLTTHSLDGRPIAEIELAAIRDLEAHENGTLFVLRGSQVSVLVPRDMTAGTTESSRRASREKRSGQPRSRGGRRATEDQHSKND